MQVSLHKPLKQVNVKLHQHNETGEAAESAPQKTRQFCSGLKSHETPWLKTIKCKLIETILQRRVVNSSSTSIQEPVKMDYWSLKN